MRSVLISGLVSGVTNFKISNWQRLARFAIFKNAKIKVFICRNLIYLNENTQSI
jgi:hypothetical protein